jgi:cytochrome P450
VDGNSFRFDFDYRPNEGLPLAAHRRLREAGPVVWSDSLNGWLVSSYEAVRTVLSDLAHFTSAGTPVADAFGGNAMLVNDGDIHNIVRAVWMKYMAKAAMAVRNDEFKRNAARALENARRRLEAGERVDFIEVLKEFVMYFVAESFEVPPDKVHVFQLYSQLSVDTPVVEMTEGSVAQERHRIAKETVLDFVAEQVNDRKERFQRGENPGDPVALMAAAEGKSGITPRMVIDNLFNLILGSLDTTEKWIGNVLVRLYSDPKLFAEISANRDLIPSMIEESMRFDTVAQVIQRKVKEGGAELGGQKMRAGDAVYVMLGTANHDAAEYKDPDAFDPRRQGASLNVGFGYGLHHCLGIHVARQENIAFVNVCIDKFPNLRVADCNYGTSWALWGPRELFMTLVK